MTDRNPPTTPPNDEELPGMLAVAKGVAEQRWPHTMDAKIWADEFVKLNPGADHGLMLGWFANAIMAGYDTAQARAVRSETTLSQGYGPDATVQAPLEAPGRTGSGSPQRDDKLQRSLTQRIYALDDGSGLISLHAVLCAIEEAEASVCPEDYGFEEWIGVLTKRDGHMAHGHLQALVSLLLQTRTPIGPMRDRKDYPSELQSAIDYLHGRTMPSAELPRNYGLAVDDPALARIRELERELAVARSATALLCRREWVELKTCACRDDQCMRATDRTMPTP